jgi:transcriptional regulator with XRE-family HTH domain
MSFADWLKVELNKRNWDQAELVRRSGVTSAQISRVVTGVRGAGPELSIAIGKGLNLPPEEVFRARGWLPSQTEKESELKLSPEVAEVAAEIEQLPLESRRIVLHVARSTAEVLRQPEK